MKACSSLCSRVIYREGNVSIEIVVHGGGASDVANQIEVPCRNAVEDVLEGTAAVARAATRGAPAQLAADGHNPYM